MYDNYIHKFLEIKIFSNNLIFKPQHQQMFSFHAGNCVACKYLRLQMFPLDDMLAQYVVIPA